MSESLICQWCSDDEQAVILYRDEKHAKRRLGFDRWICPKCETNYGDASPSIMRQRAVS